MATGSLDEACRLLDQAIQKGLQEKDEAVAKAREEVEKLDTIEAHRERVEGELTFAKMSGYPTGTIVFTSRAKDEKHPA